MWIQYQRLTCHPVTSLHARNQSLREPVAFCGSCPASSSGALRPLISSLSPTCHLSHYNIANDNTPHHPLPLPNNFTTITRPSGPDALTCYTRPLPLFFIRPYPQFVKTSIARSSPSALQQYPHNTTKTTCSLASTRRRTLL